MQIKAQFIRSSVAKVNMCNTMIACSNFKHAKDSI